MDKRKIREFIDELYFSSSEYKNNFSKNKSKNTSTDKDYMDLRFSKDEKHRNHYKTCFHFDNNQLCVSLNFYHTQTSDLPNIEVTKINERMRHYVSGDYLINDLQKYPKVFNNTRNKTRLHFSESDNYNMTLFFKCTDENSKDPRFQAEWCLEAALFLKNVVFKKYGVNGDKPLILPLNDSNTNITITPKDHEIIEQNKHKLSLFVAAWKKSQKAIANNKRIVQTEVYVRDEDIALTAKQLANGICQLCEKEAPFVANNEPYLESHHIIPLSKGGLDEVKNTIALCPNCHKKIHILENKDDISQIKEKGNIQYSKYLKYLEENHVL